MPKTRQRFMSALQAATATLGLAIGFVVLIPAVITAREKARRATCVNELFQHSGSHPADGILLNQNMRVIEVRGCPVCSRPDIGVHFIVEGREGQEPLPFFRVPEASVREGMLRLDRAKESPSYRRIRCS